MKTLMVCLLMLFVIGCIPSGESQFYCEELEVQPCVDGTLPEICVSLYEDDYCTNKVMGVHFVCDTCTEEGCRQAVMYGVEYCYDL